MSLKMTDFSFVSCFVSCFDSTGYRFPKICMKKVVNLAEMLTENTLKGEHILNKGFGYKMEAKLFQ